MKGMLGYSVFIAVIFLATVLCDIHFDVYRNKCQQYRVADELLDGKSGYPIALVNFLGNVKAGAIISPDTILVLVDEPNPVVPPDGHIKVYMKTELGYLWLEPDSHFIKDRFVVLKSRKLIKGRHRKTVACLQTGAPVKNRKGYLYFFFFNHDVRITAKRQKCSERKNVSDEFCNIECERFPYPNNTLIMHQETVPYFDIVGTYFETNQTGTVFQYIDEEAGMWIRSFFWSSDINRGPNETCGPVQLGPIPGKLPWHVAVFNGTSYLCAGSIINTRTIVTVAHCIQNTTNVTSHVHLTVVVGLNNLLDRDANSKVYQVESVIPHENYNQESFSNDIAVIRLTEHIVYTNYVQPVCLPLLDQGNSNVGVLPGWVRNEVENYHNKLETRTLSVKSWDMCGQPGRFCAADVNGANSCSNNSGGGLIIMEQGVWVLQGVASKSSDVPNTEQCDNRHLFIFTNVTHFADWIKAKVVE